MVAVWIVVDCVVAQFRVVVRKVEGGRRQKESMRVGRLGLEYAVKQCSAVPVPVLALTRVESGLK